MKKEPAQFSGCTAPLSNQRSFKLYLAAAGGTELVALVQTVAAYITTHVIPPDRAK